MQFPFRAPKQLRMLAVLSLLAALGALLAAPLVGQKFYRDDPLWKEPPARHVEKVKFRKLSDYYEFLVYPFSPPGELNGRKSKDQKETLYYAAQGVNTLGEVPDNSWYENRNYYRPMSKEEIQRGPGVGSPPDTAGKWLVYSAKNEGVTPGFRIRDPKGRRYVMKFDPLAYNEISTAADTLVSKLFYALGYFVPENYIVYFTRDQLEIDPKAKFIDADGKERSMTSRDVTDILMRVPKGPDGRYRGSASLFIEGEPVGPHRYYGTRKDDPNDIYPHEHRRDQRGLWVSSAWVGHDDSRDINSHDSLVTENGRTFVKHYLIDFGSTLGSASNRPNSPRSGNYLFSWDQVLGQFFTFGLNIPKWARAKYPNYPSVGLFEWRTFDPETWRPEYINPAFHNALPDDTFWAAKQVMAITDDQIRWAVETGQYSDPAARDWIVECLIQRRNKIGRTFFAKVLPLDRFRMEGNTLTFEDLGVKHGHYPARRYHASWASFNNQTGASSPAAGDTLSLPEVAKTAAPGSYFVARLFGDTEEIDIHVTIRREATGWNVVGIDRGWVGKSKLKFAPVGRS